MHNFKGLANPDDARGPTPVWPLASSSVQATQHVDEEVVCMSFYATKDTATLLLSSIAPGRHRAKR
jgi:hypothetical protein